ncbi:hypothetical protein CDAR_491461 [Caerostris darwini]|uniref:Uncharacterized protein n=1 Tax=Caerostris darwini TaxID=1538125 RepID=A0AAV4XAF1_9ARAC|nr:hypothetical protein CDAR_491461 [Caerostris darwini]
MSLHWTKKKAVKGNMSLWAEIFLDWGRGEEKEISLRHLSQFMFVQNRCENSITLPNQTQQDKSLCFRTKQNKGDPCMPHRPAHSCPNANYFSPTSQTDRKAMEPHWIRLWNRSPMIRLKQLMVRYTKIVPLNKEQEFRMFGLAIDADARQDNPTIFYS